MATINANLNDALIAQTALEAFTKKLAPLSAVSTSYSSEASRRGESVTVPVIASLTASNFSPATGYEGTGGTLDSLTVTIDQHKISTVSVTDQDVA